jgi:hypothetical protein
VTTLNARFDQLFRRMPGMHQSMHSGSIARAASTLPMSSVSQPKRSRFACACSLAAPSLPQMNIDGFDARTAWSNSEPIVPAQLRHESRSEITS